MIGRLQGKLVYASGNQLVVDVGGVGYEVIATSSVLAGQPKTQQEISLLIYTDVKENAITLYGFRDLLEKQVFLLLKKVKGIGSRLALGIVSAIGALELLSNIGRSDVAALQRVPGIGKKTAQRLIMELRENVGQLAAQASAPALDDDAGVSERTFWQSGEGGPDVDARLALEKLGFPSDVARSAVAEAQKECPVPAGGELDPGELLRHALTKL
jgi:holliday junction DNA helicase RuvA